MPIGVLETPFSDMYLCSVAGQGTLLSTGPKSVYDIASEIYWPWGFAIAALVRNKEN